MNHATGKPLTEEQRSYVQAPRQPNTGVDIDFRHIADIIAKETPNDPLKDFDWWSFEEKQK